MKHFLKLWGDCDAIDDVLDEIAENSDAWADDTTRQNEMRTQFDTMSILLRKLDVPPLADHLQCLHTRDTAHWRLFRKSAALAQRTAAVAGGHPGSVRLAALHPGGRIIPHIDTGIYHRQIPRAHVVLQSDAGTAFLCGDESVTMREGECWMFNSQELHSVHNPGKLTRIHLIVDVEPTGWPLTPASSPFPPRRLA